MAVVVAAAAVILRRLPRLYLVVAVGAVHRALIACTRLLTLA